MGATARDLESPMEQHQSSSPPTSNVDSSPLPSPNQPAHDTSSRSDQSFPSSCSSSSSSILADVTVVSGTLSIQMEATPAQQHAQNLQKLKPHQQGPNKDKQRHPEACLKKAPGTKGECCKCAAGFTADCAAVCCCPLAVVHLLALTFIKLPSAMAWRVLSNMKKRLCYKQIPTKGVGNEEKVRQQSPRVSLAATAAHVEHVVRLDSKNLWQHFEAGDVGFGGFSLKRDG